MNYYQQTGFVSNSDLSRFKETLQLRQARDLTTAYNFGGLVHGLITEPHKVDHANKSLNNGGEIIKFDDEAFKKAQMMQQAAEADLSLRIFSQHGKPEHEFYRRKFELEVDGIDISVPVRAKLDFYCRQWSIGCDIKTTASKSYDSFVKSIFAFDYDRQGAFYMGVAKIDRFMFIGISKHPNRRTGLHEVFKYSINYGDSTHISGYNKYSKLLLKYALYIQDF